MEIRAITYRRLPVFPLMSPDLVQTLKRHKSRMLAGGLTLTICWRLTAASREWTNSWTSAKRFASCKKRTPAWNTRTLSVTNALSAFRNSAGEPDGEVDLEIHRMNLAKPGEHIFMLPEK